MDSSKSTKNLGDVGVTTEGATEWIEEMEEQFNNTAWKCTKSLIPFVIFVDFVHTCTPAAVQLFPYGAFIFASCLIQQQHQNQLC